MSLLRISTHISLIYLLGLSVTIAGCNSSAETSDAQVIKDVSEWHKGNCEDLQRLTTMIGDSEADILRGFGEADREERFIMWDSMNEFRIELLNLFPLPQNNQREIIERHWSKNSCNLTIWFSDTGHGMMAVQALQWPEGVDF